MMCGECLCMFAYLIQSRCFKKGKEKENVDETGEPAKRFNPILLWPVSNWTD